MRSIQFRAWNERLNKMMEVLEIVLDPEIGGVSVWGKDHVDYLTGEHEADQVYWPCADIELMQFTGLLDLNGKKIYEGDILSGQLYRYQCHQTSWIHPEACN